RGTSSTSAPSRRSSDTSSPGSRRRAEPDRVPRHFTATPSGEGLRIGVALARFNQSVTELLLAGTLDALARHGVAEDAIDVATVPGAFELPLCAQRLASTGRYDALVCLGAVVRGETPHFEYVAAEAARGIGEVARRHDLPVAFGVLTADTIEQA